jgi:hypothetical protein
MDFSHDRGSGEPLSFFLDADRNNAQSQRRGGGSCRAWEGILSELEQGYKEL